jgi:DNA-binding NarL/FixJ family response regulator
VDEFVYGWGNDYAWATDSNLDVTLRTLLAAAPQAKVIVVMQPSEEAHIGKLLHLFSVHAVLKFPIPPEQLRAALQDTATDTT